MPDRVIIADSSTLIALSLIGKLDLLQSIYSQITIIPKTLEFDRYLRVEIAPDIIIKPRRSYGYACVCFFVRNNSH